MPQVDLLDCCEVSKCNEFIPIFQELNWDFQTYRQVSEIWFHTRSHTNLLIVMVDSSGPQAAWSVLCNTKVTIHLLILLDPQPEHYQTLLAQCQNVLVAPITRQDLLHQLSQLRNVPDAGRFQPAFSSAPVSGLTMIGESARFQQMLEELTQIAPYDQVPVLIKGETGTGKELVARGIHYESSRRDGPFVPVNCGALNDELFLSELFGHEKGAFTDAKQTHKGLLEQASDGTVFLDEVDSLSPKAQVALLRFLQEQEFRPLGSQKVKKADVRVISASNQDLYAFVQHGRFREDLYYRLDILDILLPPLRERKGDIELLSEYFLRQFGRQYQEPEKNLHPETIAWMLEYPWPGNVRELENYLHRVFILTQGNTIYVPQIKGRPFQVQILSGGEGGDAMKVGDFNEEKAKAIAHFEKQYIHRVLKASKGNVTLAAKQAGKERRAFGRLIKKYGINREMYLAGEL